jgi:16S rRNA G1207 methylase RsmC
MLDLAGVVPGMHMLEPSAGRGAIAVRAVERGAEVECFEIQPELLSDCAAELANTADHAGRPAVLHLGDFLLAKPRPVFDAVVMNPPFARRDGGDAAHILHAYRFLKPSGRLVAVASAGVAFRESADDKALRRLAEDGGSIEPLPDRTFSSAGTDVRTVLVTLRA